MTSALRGLPAAARAEAAGDRRLRVVLPDADADDPRRRHVDGALHGQAHHAPGADAGDRRPRDRRRALRLPRGDPEPTTSSARSPRRSTSWRASWRPAAQQLERLGRGARAPPPRRGKPAPLRRDRARTNRDRRRVGGRRRAHPHVQLGGAPAARASTPTPSGQRGRPTCSARRSCSPLAALLDGGTSARDTRPQDVVDHARRPRAAPGGRWRRRCAARTAAATARWWCFDDISPLIRAQKVAAWREVARRLAHEIKNPLTPIQLSAERLRRHFGQAPDTHARAGRGVHEHHHRRGRVARRGWSTSSRSSRACRRRARCRPTLHRARRRRAGALRRPVAERPRSSGATGRPAAACVSTRSRCGASC